MKAVFRVPRNGTTLVGDSWLSDRPVITLLHAGVADRRSWFTLADTVLDFASVLAYDRRGFGESLPGGAQFTHLEDLLAVLDQLDIERTWLIGSSAGGKLAIEAALEATDRVEGMILISPAIGGAPPTRDEDVDAQTEEIDGLITLAEERGDLNEVNRLEVHWWLDGPRQVEGRVVGSVRNLVLDMNAIALANFIQENTEDSVDGWSRLGELSIPTVVACGSLDATHVIRRSEVVGSRIPGARYVSLEGMAHLPYLENPSAIATLIRESF